MFSSNVRDKQVWWSGKKRRKKLNHVVWQSIKASNLIKNHSLSLTSPGRSVFFEWPRTMKERQLFNQSWWRRFHSLTSPPSLYLMFVISALIFPELVIRTYTLGNLHKGALFLYLAPSRLMQGCVFAHDGVLIRSKNRRHKCSAVDAHLT